MFSIKETNIKPILEECFSTDKALIDHFHIYAGKGFDACVQKTYEDLLALQGQYDFFKVSLGVELIGFFGVEHTRDAKFLTGFFIKPQWRSKKNDFVNLIKQEMSGPFLCGLYKKNTRAIKFLKSISGGVIFEDNSVIAFKVGE